VASLAEVALPPELRWEACAGVLGAFDAPRSSLEGRIPPAFTPADAGPATIGVVFEALRCGRAISTHEVLPDAALFHAFVRVQPANGSWGPEHPSHYDLDVVAAGDGLPEALAALGVHAVAARLRTETVGALERWSFDATGSTVELAFDEDDSRGLDVVRHAYHWFGEQDGLRRVQVDKDFQYEGLPRTVGTLRASGALRLAESLPACCPAWDGQRYMEDDETWSVDGQVYVG
jgi:hypothetical protein